MIRRPPRSTLFPTRRSSDLMAHISGSLMAVYIGMGADAVAILATSVMASPCRSEEHTSELQSHVNLVCRLLLEKKKNIHCPHHYNTTTTQSRFARLSISVYP